MRDRMYQIPVRGVVDLRQRLIETRCKALWTVLKMNCVRLQACVDEKEHFEQMLWHLARLQTDCVDKLVIFILCNGNKVVDLYSA